tara:strand:+ start:286 stop:630 length:345 start_codon:yes stop_codon:yes gene_type:complete
MRKLEVKIRQTIWAFKKSFEPSECFSVNYEGFEFVIKPSFTKDNCWNLYARGTKEPLFYRIDGNKLKVNYRSFKRWFSNFKSMYRHQKFSWYSIDIRKPIGTRLSYISSDNIRF